jgi:hypothetical protein
MISTKPVGEIDGDKNFASDEILDFFMGVG